MKNIPRKSNPHLRENKQNIRNRKIHNTEKQAVQVLTEISNQETKYKSFEWIKGETKCVSELKQQIKFQKVPQCSLQINQNIPKIKSKFKLPTLRAHRYDRILTQQPQVSLNHEGQAQEEEQLSTISSNMNSVCGFLKYKTNKNPRRYCSTHSHKNKAEKNMHMISTDEHRILNCIEQDEIKRNQERVQQIKFWLRQKRAQCKSLHKLLDKYCGSNKKIVAQKNEEEKLSNQRNAGIKIRALFWNH